MQSISALAPRVALALALAFGQAEACDIFGEPSAKADPVFFKDGMLQVDKKGEAKLVGLIAEDLIKTHPQWKDLASHGPFAGFQYGEPDRFGRWPIHVFGENPDRSRYWLQERLVRQGLARVDERVEDFLCFRRLMDGEIIARRDRKGLWADPHYAILDASRPSFMEAHINTYSLVEGKVLHSARVGDRIYLNFGPIWKEDFTVIIRRRSERRLQALGIEPLGLSGKRVHVRGWLTVINGPSIEVRHPFQLTVIPDS